MGERDADVAHLQWSAGELVAGARQLRRARGPTAVKNVERMLESGLNAHLNAVAAHAKGEQHRGCRGGGGRSLEPHDR